MTYDKVGRIIKEESFHSKTEYKYNQGNLLISQTDLPTNVTTLYTYDKAGRKIKVTNTKQKVEYQFRKSYNSNTDLNNYGFRDYSSSIGRFITQDPIRAGTNWYTLAVNNPINFVDLWGLCTANEKPKNVWENYTGAGNPYATQMINRDKSTSGTKNPYEGIKDENSYNIIPYYISEKSQNRQQTQIRTVKAIVIHWTAVPNQSPIDTIDYCSKFYKNNSFSLALDNDEAGIKATKEIYDAFKGKGIDIEINEYHEIMKELNINDLNDLLIKEYIDPVDRLMDWSKGSKEMER